jgi:hypothetical protein
MVTCEFACTDSSGGPGTIVAGLFGKVRCTHKYLLPAFEEIFVGVNRMYTGS